MERRSFIKKSSAAIATTALIGLPEIVNAGTLLQTADKEVTFKYELPFNEKKEGNKEYTLKFYTKAITDFKNSENKKISFEFKTYPSDYSTHIYEISKVKKDKQSNKIYNITAKYKGPKFESTKKVDKQFKKKLYFNIILSEPFTNSSLELKNSKKKRVAILKPLIPKTYSGSNTGAGCYITTACVVSKNLADNCHELETLRNLRDTYILNTIEGKNWIKLYYKNAPNLVKRINSYSNSEEIYNYIYTHFIDRAVKLVENKQEKQAFEFYKACVLNINSIIK